MAEDLDVEAMLEEHFTEQNSSQNGNGNTIIADGDVHSVSSSTQNDESDIKKRRRRSKSREDRHKSPKKHHDRRSKSRSRERDRKKRRSRDKSKDRSSRRSRSRSRERRRKHSVSKSRSRSRERRKDREHSDRHKNGHSNRHRSRSTSRDRRSSDSHHRRHRHSHHHSSHRYDRSRSRSRSRHLELTAEERDQRTVLCVQLAPSVRQRDLQEFFASAGKVREARLILDNKTRKHKGIAYIEFQELASVPLALALNGQQLCGRPIIIQPSQAEKNRAAASTVPAARNLANRVTATGLNSLTSTYSLTSTSSSFLGSSCITPMRLYVGSLHFNITEDMLRGIFEPFGPIDKIELMREPETNRSKGYAFITFSRADDAKKALEQLNGFELAGRPMKVNHVTERTDSSALSSSILDSEETDRSGIELGTTGRLQLMAKLAEGTGIQLPKAAMTALQMGSVPMATSQTSQPTLSATVTPAAAAAAAVIPSQCFILTNMFDPKAETGDNWDDEIKADVVDECRNHGEALHVYVDKGSPGNVYVKCSTIPAAVACVQALNNRWFSGRLVTAQHIPLASYHTLFPDSLQCT